MFETRTDRDVRIEVVRALDGREAEFDVDGLVAEIVRRYGLGSIDDIPPADFWHIVARFDTTAASDEYEADAARAEAADLAAWHDQN